jgi:hypothetical protein
VVCLKELYQKEVLSNTELAKLILEKKIDEYDEFLLEELPIAGYGCRTFDIETT